ncbi:carboxylating nicotinate-nucleotide diphosphorylase [Priestia taiwanensis]|uniref:Probable nicotinate-nucleotide pyrophosphorylase [carboxylating] n=1 Tax=Priestia taiwanensis TaxID=1347902 RepID=A0A917AU24_9BACI|nr:carboxylating nicotinate-nucleotide diphosphorylase [Priestia taiwanensis]MBM7363628.1 nicotinate-nucleotide pyrophosphorylase (carboxylating) [Priestia taiwanensis]GGE75479.1 nicotinate-nucleotide diphosphorylase (carboxylating) [Priestia taiwanensis]
MNIVKVKREMERFFLEDIGERDISVQYIFNENDIGEGAFVAKVSGVLAGVSLIELGYGLLSSRVLVTYEKADGDYIQKGDVIARVRGPMRTLLSGERVILNMIQRMSGIATATKEMVEALNSDHTRICDTRKTMPGLRMFDKYAVTCGGGYNHRYGLSDGVMLKDNHIAYAGSIGEAVAQVRASVGHMVKIEVETETKDQVLEAIESNVDVIMFDNRSPEEVTEYMKIVPSHIVTEASGGIGLHNISTYHHTGVDYISLGCLTHSVTALDISFNIRGGIKG